MPEGLPHPRHRWFAAFYDVTDRMGEKRMAPLRNRLVAGLRGAVLEVGCGTGSNFRHYEWSHITLEATEPDPYMRRRAEQRLEGLPVIAREHIRLSDSPAEALPFPDGHFDAIVSCLVLCTVSDLPRSLQEMWRVLKPGGELRLLEHVSREGKWGSVQRAVQPVYGWMSGACRLDRDTEQVVRDAGFELEVWERLSFSPVHPAFVGVGRKVASL